MRLIIMYIENMIGYMIIFLPFYLIGRFIFLKLRRKKIKMINELLIIIFALYLVGLASQTIIPQWDMGVISDTGEFYFDVNLTTNLSRVNFVPFLTISQYFFETNTQVDSWNAVSLLNIIANVFLFSPLGFLTPLIWNKFNSVKKVFILGLSVTCLIEFTQFFIGRSTDIDDVILNTFGVMIGYGVFFIFYRNRKRIT